MKKFLALTLALTMALSLSASAASYSFLDYFKGIFGGSSAVTTTAT